MRNRWGRRTLFLHRRPQERGGSGGRFASTEYACHHVFRLEGRSLRRLARTLGNFRQQRNVLQLRVCSFRSWWTTHIAVCTVQGGYSSAHKCAGQGWGASLVHPRLQTPARMQALRRPNRGLSGFRESLLSIGRRRSQNVAGSTLVSAGVASISYKRGTVRGMDSKIYGIPRNR